MSQPFLGRWCLRSSAMYGDRCKPDLKALQAMYDNGFETMKPRPPERKIVKQAEEKDDYLLLRAMLAWHG